MYGYDSSDRHVSTQHGSTMVSYVRDVSVSANAVGVKQGSTVVYDPFGSPVSGGVPDNGAGSFDFGWVGSNLKGLEHASGVGQVIEMGARIYQPALGRFLAVDPVEGGCSNSYVYVNDPVNDSDLSGMKCPFLIQVAASTLGYGDVVRLVRAGVRGQFMKAGGYIIPLGGGFTGASDLRVG